MHLFLEWSSKTERNFLEKDVARFLKTAASLFSDRSTGHFAPRRFRHSVAGDRPRVRFTHQQIQKSIDHPCNCQPHTDSRITSLLRREHGGLAMEYCHGLLRRNSFLAKQRERRSQDPQPQASLPRPGSDLVWLTSCLKFQRGLGFLPIISTLFRQ